MNILSKIKMLFSRNKKDINSIRNETNKTQNDYLRNYTKKCKHCGESIESSRYVSCRDESGIYYIRCEECCFVNKIKDNIVKIPDLSEINVAQELFKNVGFDFGFYSKEKNGDKYEF